MNDVDRWVQPLRIAALSLLNLLLKHGKNTTGRIAIFESLGEWVCEKIFLCAFFVRFHCIIKNYLKVGRCRSRVSVGHMGEK